MVWQELRPTTRKLLSTRAQIWHVGIPRRLCAGGEEDADNAVVPPLAFLTALASTAVVCILMQMEEFRLTRHAYGALVLTTGK